MRNTTKLSLSTIVEWDPEQITTEIDGEVLAMSIRRGVYVGLDPVASGIWKRLASPQSIEALCSQLRGEYQGDPEVMAADVIEMMGELCDLGVLTARGTEAAAGAAA